MEPIGWLSEIIIGTLKEFSAERRALTQDALRDALSTKKEVICLMFGVGSAGPPNTETLDCVSSENEPGRIHEPPQSSPGPEIAYFSQMRNILSNVLTGLGPITREEYLQRSSELQRRLGDCQSMEALTEQGEDLVGFVNSLACNAIEEIHHSSDFLSELSKDLSGMEEQLFSYQDFNRETHVLNEQFRGNLLSDTDEMTHAFNADKGVGDTRSLIASKIATIRKAIEVKWKEDEARFREADTKITELQVSVRNSRDEITQVTERANNLEKEVLLDALTEIGNRRAYELKIRESLRRYHREGQPFSLILIDVDRFKSINDNYGHSAGDKCLKEIARIIKFSLRKTDFLARYGGEELIAVLDGSSAENAGRLAEKIRSRIEKAHFCFRDEEIPVTISLGVTEVSPADHDPEAPFIRVDDALYRAKGQGRNGVCVIRDGPA